MEQPNGLFGVMKDLAAGKSLNALPTAADLGRMFIDFRLRQAQTEDHDREEKSGFRAGAPNE